MNTSDIANMEQGQWVFWIAAIGLTVIVVVIALVWADEFGNTYREMLRLLRGDWIRDKSVYGHAQLPTLGRARRDSSDPNAQGLGVMDIPDTTLGDPFAPNNMQHPQAQQRSNSWYPESARRQTQFV